MHRPMLQNVGRCRCAQGRCYQHRSTARAQSRFGFLRGRWTWNLLPDCFSRIIPLSGEHLRRMTVSFVDHWRLERDRQGLSNRLIEARAAYASEGQGRFRRRRGIGGPLNCYRREAARFRSNEFLHYTRVLHRRAPDQRAASRYTALSSGPNFWIRFSQCPMLELNALFGPNRCCSKFSCFVLCLRLTASEG